MLLLPALVLIGKAAHMVLALFQLLLALWALLQLASMASLLSTAPGIWRSSVVHLHASLVCHLFGAIDRSSSKCTGFGLPICRLCGLPAYDELLKSRLLML